MFLHKFDILKRNLNGLFQKCKPVVTKLCAVTKLGDLTVFGLHGIAYLKSKLAAPILLAQLYWEEHFDPASPFLPDNAYLKSCSKRKRKYWVLERNGAFQFKITPDRHNAIQKLNCCVLPHPAHFSLQSTFKVPVLCFHHHSVCTRWEVRRIVNMAMNMTCTIWPMHVTIQYTQTESKCYHLSKLSWETAFRKLPHGEFTK
jgi:hypothetical protein